MIIWVQYNMLNLLKKIKLLIVCIVFLNSFLAYSEDLIVPDDAYSIDIFGEYIEAPIIEENTIGDARIALVNFTALINENNFFSGSFIDHKLAAYAALEGEDLVVVLLRWKMLMVIV